MAASSNFGEFSASLKNWIGATKETYNKVAREATRDLFFRIIDDSPVDITEPDQTVFRGDWSAAIGKEPEAVDRNDRNGEGARDSVNAAMAEWRPAQTGESAIFVNHHDYGGMLEYGLYEHSVTADPPRTTPEGFSTQAPEGFVEIHVQEWDDIVVKAQQKVWK
jgi:hypothetical protein